jgi:hypothetical protein
MRQLGLAHLEARVRRVGGEGRPRRVHGRGVHAALPPVELVVGHAAEQRRRELRVGQLPDQRLLVHVRGDLVGAAEAEELAHQALLRDVRLQVRLAVQRGRVNLGVAALVGRGEQQQVRREGLVLHHPDDVADLRRFGS